MLPGSAAGQERIPDGQYELGLGIHGEKGVERRAMEPVEDIVRRVVERIAVGDDQQIAVLLNNLGAVPPMEMDLIANQVLSSSIGRRTKVLLGPAHVMTSLQMNGFSLSVLPLTDHWKDLLLQPVDPTSWPRAVEVPAPPAPLPLPDLPDTFRFDPSGDTVVETKLRAALGKLIDLRDELNQIDGKVGDADAGDTLSTAAQLVLDNMSKLPLASPSDLCLTIGDLLARSGGGSSGVVLSILFTASGRQFAADPSSTWKAALRAGTDAVTTYGGARRGDRTLLDALIPAIDHLPEGLTAAAAAAEKGAEETKKMGKAGAGRAAYISDLEGVIDPGAYAVAQVFLAVSKP